MYTQNCNDNSDVEAINVIKDQRCSLVSLKSVSYAEDTFTSRVLQITAFQGLLQSTGICTNRCSHYCR